MSDYRDPNGDTPELSWSESRAACAVMFVIDGEDLGETVDWLLNDSGEVDIPEEDIYIEGHDLDVGEAVGWLVREIKRLNEAGRS